MNLILLEGESAHFAGKVFVCISNRFSAVIDQENTYHLHPTFHAITLLLLYDSLHRFFTINLPVS